ncbi:sugar phosphate isomerase/epimerase family protein [Sediminivirga luteola]|uniref:Xylose isomerase-like TIM barrel domain-containing protein n=1 Tax=Sediminivirga luteola TaxID=1774748 RepID=A0A8J2XKV1_9MICO|nr:sugar phosphate isomerase/epimerase family protein [Sediminivirga luteola]GGA12856.1 hypothetical protein GCM10011333_14700 [Sediminivirga luteola]
MSTSEPAALVATCWTSAGAAVPGEGDQCSPFSLRERIEAVATAGYAGAGFVLADLAGCAELAGYAGRAGGAGPTERDGMSLAELAAAMEDLGLWHREVELIEDWNLSGGADADATTALLDAAVALDAAFVKVGPPRGPALGNQGPRGAGLAASSSGEGAQDRTASDWDGLVAPMRELADRAAVRGVRLALEPLPFARIPSIPAGAEFVRAVSRDNLGLAVDFWHVFRAGTSLDELAGALRPGEITAVELCDADAAPVGNLFDDTRHRRRYCGEGAQDVAGFIGVMRGLGFEGPWGVEILSAEHRARPLDEGLKKARDTALASFPPA